MDLEFAAAGRRLDKERDARKRALDLQRRRNEKARLEAQAAEARLQERAAERRREKLAQEAAVQEKELRNAGVAFDVLLKCVPLAKADTNRVTLPKSALEALERQRALDRVGGPLMFELSVLGDQTGGAPSDGARRTHCGVDEFTAEEGTVGIPPAVALSLGREQGVDWLDGKTVRVQFAQLGHHSKVSVALQPRGEGFHLGEQETVNIDIKSVLLRTLRGALTLTQGDWVPLRHEGRTYELVVTSVLPEPAVSLLNTDVEVDLLPSENEQARQLEAERRKTWEARRSRRLAALRESLGAEPPEGAGPLIRVRLMDGKMHTRRFARTAPLGELIDWVATLLPDPPAHVAAASAAADADAEFVLIRAGAPGSPKQVFGFSARDEALGDLGIAGARESLLVDWNGSGAESASLEAAPAPAPPAAVGAAEGGGLKGEHAGVESGLESFAAAREAAERQLDQDLEQTQLRAALEEGLRGDAEDDEQTKVDKVQVYHALVAQGVTPYKAATAAQSFSKQIVALETMGFTEHVRSLPLLEKYQGRLERVVNVLAGGD